MRGVPGWGLRQRRRREGAASSRASWQLPIGHNRIIKQFSNDHFFMLDERYERVTSTLSTPNVSHKRVVPLPNPKRKCWWYLGSAIELGSAIILILILILILLHHVTRPPGLLLNRKSYS
jgi:hypothetical protein